MSKNVERTSPEAFRVCAEVEDEDLQTVLQIAWVSAYRCPCVSYEEPGGAEEFQLSWESDLATA